MNSNLNALLLVVVMTLALHRLSRPWFAAGESAGEPPPPPVSSRA
jgi:hypothetical protein